MSFKIKVILGITLTMIMGVVISTLVAAKKIKHEGVQGLVGKSKAILSRVEAVRDYVASQGGFKLAVEKAVKEYPDGNLPDDIKKEIVMHVPVFAAMQVGLKNSDAEKYKFRVFSDEPRNKDNMATAEEMKIFKKFEQDVNLPEIVTEYEDQVVVYRPVRILEKNGCLACHGNPQASPFKNGKDILGYRMENWHDGKLHAVFGIVSDLTPVKEASTKASWLILVFCAIGGIGSLFIGFWIVNSSIKKMVEVTSYLSEAGGGVKSASHDIEVSSQTLSSSSSQAAASIEETTASTEQVASMIKMTSTHAASAKDLSNKCEEHARIGAEEVQKLIHAMSEITDSSKRIEEITNVIEDISFQTNLLALNAAVEAARAGEQGKGFAVVADAVRSLAHRSSASAKEISTLIQDSVEKIKDGAELAVKSGESLKLIVQSVEKVSQLNGEISSASKEQDVGLANINRAIIEMDKVTQGNAKQAQDTENSSKKLSTQADQLYGLVDDLNEVLYGKKAG